MALPFKVQHGRKHELIPRKTNTTLKPRWQLWKYKRGIWCKRWSSRRPCPEPSSLLSPFLITIYRLMTLSSNSSQTSSMLCKLYIQWSQPAPFRYLKAILNRTWLKQNSILLRAALPQYPSHFRKQFQYLPSCLGQKSGSHPNSPSPHDIHAFPNSVLPTPFQSVLIWPLSTNFILQLLSRLSPDCRNSLLTLSLSPPSPLQFSLRGFFLQQESHHLSVLINTFQPKCLTWCQGCCVIWPLPAIPVSFLSQYGHKDVLSVSQNTHGLFKSCSFYFQRSSPRCFLLLSHFLLLIAAASSFSTPFPEFYFFIGLIHAWTDFHWLVYMVPECLHSLLSTPSPQPMLAYKLTRGSYPAVFTAVSPVPISLEHSN